MKLWTRFLILTLIVISIFTLAIKFYFMNQAYHHLELSIKDQIKRDMIAFEQMILIVATVAGKNENVVRKALFSISENQNIPVQLRRSELIVAKYGTKAGHEAQNESEKKAFETGKAVFRKNDQYLEYIYPLKAHGICQNCHTSQNGIKVTPDYVLGLAVKKVPRSVLKESSISYHIMDLFWENLFLMILGILILTVALYYWFVFPLFQLTSRVKPAIIALDEDIPGSANNIQFLSDSLDILISEKKIEKEK